jgi:hypothetical protein
MDLILIGRKTSLQIEQISPRSFHLKLATDKEKLDTILTSNEVKELHEKLTDLINKRL